MEHRRIFLVGTVAVLLLALVFQLVTSQYGTIPERGVIKEFQEEIASGVIEPGKCLTVVKEDKERFVSSDPNRRGWVRITEIIKDIEICKDPEVGITRSYHAHVIQCDKSPDLTTVVCREYHAPGYE